jgi:hypothetical protein
MQRVFIQAFVRGLGATLAVALLPTMGRVIGAVERKLRGRVRVERAAMGEGYRTWRKLRRSQGEVS